jgi:hypothetical protein
MDTPIGKASESLFMAQGVLVTACPCGCHTVKLAFVDAAGVIGAMASLTPRKAVALGADLDTVGFQVMAGEGSDHEHRA